MKRIIISKILFFVLIFSQVKLFSYPGTYTRNQGGRNHFITVHNNGKRAQERRKKFNGTTRTNNKTPKITCAQVTAALGVGVLLASGLMQWYMKKSLET